MFSSAVKANANSLWRVQAGHRMFVLTFLLGKPELKSCIRWQSLSIPEKSNYNLPLFYLKRLPRQDLQKTGPRLTGQSKGEELFQPLVTLCQAPAYSYEPSSSQKLPITSHLQRNLGKRNCTKNCYHRLSCHEAITEKSRRTNIFLHFEAAVQKTVNDLKNRIGSHFSILCNTSHLRVAMVIKTIIMF